MLELFLSLSLSLSSKMTRDDPHKRSRIRSDKKKKGKKNEKKNKDEKKTRTTFVTPNEKSSKDDRDANDDAMTEATIRGVPGMKSVLEMPTMQVRRYVFVVSRFLCASGGAFSVADEIFVPLSLLFFRARKKCA